jgi:hypothetical protein
MSSVHPVPSEWAASAKINAERYDAMYAQSLSDPEGFWRKEAQRLDWMTPFTKVKNTSFNEADFGVLNANCIDRHLPKSAATRPRSSGKATIRRQTSTSPIASCTTRSAASPTC